jgi:hypothetical protein
MVVLTLVAVTGLRSSVIEEQVSGNQKIAASSLFGAEQGVSAALDDMFDGTISDSGSESDVNWSVSGYTSGTGYGSLYIVKHLIRSGIQVEDDDGRRYFVIDSTGWTNTGAGRRLLEVAVALEWGASSNVAGFIGCRGITGDSNIVTGSYSSSGGDSDGDRGDMATTDANAFLYLDGSSDMDIVGEVRSTGALFMKSDALVRRDALANLRVTIESGDVYGSAWTNGSFVGNSGSVHGDIYQGNTVVPNPIVPMPDCDPLGIDAIVDGALPIMGTNNNADIGISAGGDYSGSPAQLGVVGGGDHDYWLRNFTMDGVDATIHGDVRMYITGDFRMNADADLYFSPNSSLKIYMESGVFEMNSNSDANQDGRPINMQIWSRAVNTVKDDKLWQNNEPDVWDPGDAKVIINSNSRLWGMIYAPRAHVYLDSNVQLWGSVRGRFASTFSNFNFNYDEDLDDLYVGNPTDYKLVYWVEKYPE